MNTAEVLPRKGIWRAFWIIWAVIFAALNGWLSFVIARAHPFSRSYTLGIDEVDETYRLSWLAWGGYSVDLRWMEPRYMDGMGGDMAVELVSDRGEVVIPRKFIGEKHWSAESFGGFRAGLFDRYTMRVTTVKTGAFPRRHVELRVAGSFVDSGLVFFANNMIFAIVMLLSVIILAIVLRVIAGKQRRALGASSLPNS